MQAGCTKYFTPDTSMKFSGYVGNKHSFKKIPDTSFTYAGIQDGGQNSKRLPVMYDVVCISLSLPYKIDIHVEMYDVKVKEYKYINSS